ncbi:CBS domain-containing protein [Dokdonella sp.]|uniref:CBS domain-containing protein n=1 Tax=Dokdonella sp. TaxID=2291710 RepID=UPI002636C978|nr:CBS domain-containing protein [Dokdonella sp.]
MTKIREMMTSGVHLARPDQTLADAAKLMAEADVGSLPVSENDRLVGMVTDRDLVVRGIALGLDARTPVRDVMTEEVKYCFDDEDVSHVARNMAELGVRRLPVVDRDKRLVGMVALSNVAYGGDGRSANAMLRGVASPH